MWAIGYHQAGGIDRGEALMDIELPISEPGPRELLVEVRAVSVNPVALMVPSSAAPKTGQWKVLGWDAAGIVRAAGSGATLFHAGDAVFYAGTIGRAGTNSQFHLVDERIVGAKPQSLGWAEAAAMPLTSITAWEALFTRLDVHRPVPGATPAVVVVGGAGGVGSVAIQLARALTDLTVIATASRPETIAWVREMGAHHVIDHTKPLAAQVAALGIGAPGFVLSTTHTGQHLGGIAELIAPQGRLALIDDPSALDINLLKGKSVSVHWESMFTRSVYVTPDIGEQGKLLNEVSRLLDGGRLRTTMTQRYSPIDAANLKRAHALIEANTARGKVVLEGFGADHEPTERS